MEECVINSYANKINCYIRKLLRRSRIVISVIYRGRGFTYFPRGLWRASALSCLCNGTSSGNRCLHPSCRCRASLSIPRGFIQSPPPVSARRPMLLVSICSSSFQHVPQSKAQARGRSAQSQQKVFVGSGK